MKHTIFQGNEAVHCHASTIEYDIDGNLVACWFAGSWEGHPDNAIWWSRQLGGGTWSKPDILFKAKDRVAHWNPVLFKTQDGSLMLFFKIGVSPMDWQTVTATYTNGVWSTPKLFGGWGGRGPSRNKPIISAAGTWLAPASLETPRYLKRFERPFMEWTSFVDWSDDGGQSWSATEPIPSSRDVGLIQPAMWESTAGNVHMLIRSNAGKIYRSDSTDGGKAWSPAKATLLPNPNSAIDVLKLSNGWLVLAYNHCAGDWGLRSPLSLVFSGDNGANWSKRIDVETGNMNFSYPSLCSKDNVIWMSYSKKRTSIELLKLSLQQTRTTLDVSWDGASKIVDVPV